MYMHNQVTRSISNLKYPNSITPLRESDEKYPSKSSYSNWVSDFLPSTDKITLSYDCSLRTKMLLKLYLVALNKKKKMVPLCLYKFPHYFPTKNCF